MVFLLVCQVQWLFCQSIAYLAVYKTKIRNNKYTFQFILEKPLLKRYSGWIIDLCPDRLDGSGNCIPNSLLTKLEGRHNKPVGSTAI
jgi:hypothetical protein